QNYIKIINNNCKNENKYEVTREITSLLSNGDILENYIYGEQNWDMNEVHGFYTCVAPSYLLTENLVTRGERMKIDFPQDLNNTSIKNINKRNIINANKCLKNMDINDYIYVNQLVRKLIADG